jgi:hypothetical protein
MEGVNMPAFKFTMVFRYISGTSPVSPGNRAGGWTESVYQSTYTAQRLTAFRELAQARAQLLPEMVGVIGIRVQQVDPSRSAATFPANYPGGGNIGIGARDIPQMAVKLTLNGSGVTNVCKMALAAIPDPQVTNGEFVPLQRFGVDFIAYLTMLNNWLFRATDLAQAPRTLLSIGTDGTYTTNADLVLAVDSLVKVKRAVDGNGNLVGGVFKVKTVTTNRIGILDGWTFGSCTGGTITPYVLIYPQISNAQLATPKIGVRKIGRPSDPYRGRRSRRRR